MVGFTFGGFLLVLLVPFIISTEISVFDQGLPDSCLVGPFHKKIPGPESDAFLECRSWKKMSCCNLNVSHEIHHNRAETFYNYFWDRCGQLSQPCEQYLKNEECFYQCEPMLTYYERPGKAGYIRDAPVCASYCDGFYEACKNDKTCVENWLGDWSYADDGLNSCPNGSECVTFEEMYGNGKGLCDKMWGDAFYHESDSRDCMVMHFNPEGENPNLTGNRATNAAGDTKSSASITFTGALMVPTLIAKWIGAF